MEERWEGEKKKGWLYHTHNEWLLKVFEQGNDAVSYESIFLAVQDLLVKYKYWKRTNKQTIATILASKSPDKYHTVIS